MGPHEYLGAPKDPPRGPKWLKVTTKEKKLKNRTESIIRVHFLADSTLKYYNTGLWSIWGPWAQCEAQ